MVSSEPNKLFAVGESIKSIIYPFRYESLYFPYLHEPLFHYMYLLHIFIIDLKEIKNSLLDWNLEKFKAYCRIKCK